MCSFIMFSSLSTITAGQCNPEECRHNVLDWYHPHPHHHVVALTAAATSHLRLLAVLEPAPQSRWVSSHTTTNGGTASLSGLPCSPALDCLKYIDPHLHHWYHHPLHHWHTVYYPVTPLHSDLHCLHIEGKSI